MTTLQPKHRSHLIISVKNNAEKVYYSVFESRWSEIVGFTRRNSRAQSVCTSNFVKKKEVTNVWIFDSCITEQPNIRVFNALPIEHFTNVERYSLLWQIFAKSVVKVRTPKKKTTTEESKYSKMSQNFALLGPEYPMLSSSFTVLSKWVDWYPCSLHTFAELQYFCCCQ